jgi:hypothetical protein
MLTPLNEKAGSRQRDPAFSIAGMNDNRYRSELDIDLV